MIPPTSGREHDPSAAALAPAAPDEASSFRDDDNTAIDEQSYVAARTSPRVKILLFGILAGGLMALIYSTAQAVLMLALGGPSISPFAQDTFGTSGRTLFQTFIWILISAAPWFFLIATLAAAAQVLLRRSERDARATRALLKALAQRPRDLSRHVRVPERSAQQIVEPLERELDLELEPRTPRP
jgi:hypothetical protein